MINGNEIPIETISWNIGIIQMDISWFGLINKKEANSKSLNEASSLPASASVTLSLKLVTSSFADTCTVIKKEKGNIACYSIKKWNCRFPENIKDFYTKG